MPFNSGCAVPSEAASGFAPPLPRGLDTRPRLPSDVSPAPVSQVADLHTRGDDGRDGDGNAQVALVAPVLNRFAAQWRVNGGSGVTVE